MQSDYDKASDISELSLTTDIKVFRGGLGLNKQTKNAHNSIPVLNKEKKDLKELNSNSHQNREEVEKHEMKKIKDKLEPKESLSPNHGNMNCMLSFRSKKENSFTHIQYNNETEQHNKNDETLTQEIINKLVTLKIHNKPKMEIISENKKSEDDAINKLFLKNTQEEPDKMKRKLKILKLIAHLNVIIITCKLEMMKRKILKLTLIEIKIK